MRKNLQYKILVAIMAASAVNGALPANVLSGYEQDGNYYVESNGEIVNSNYNLIYGDGNSFTIDGGTISGAVGAGDEDYNGVVSDGNITINDGTITSNVFGGMAENGIVHNNHVTINNGAIYNVYGGYGQKSAVHNNTVIINDGTVSYVYGAASDNVSVTENKVYIKGGSVNFIVGGFSPESNAGSNTVDISGSAVTTGEIYGGYSYDGIADNNNVNISGNSQIISSIRGGYSENGTAEHNIVNISGGTIGSDEYSRNVYGGHSYDGNAIDNIVNISGGSVNGDVYGGYSENSSANNNNITISGTANIENANLYGSNKTTNTGNTLNIYGWSSSTQSAKNFNNINFDNINWQNGGTVLTITEGAENDLANTEIYLNSIAGGSKIAAGDTMTLIKSTNNVNLGIDKDNIKVKDNFFAGVATEGTGTATVNDDGSVDFKVDTLKANSQIDIVAENRAVAAAFVNQGTDLISDSLDTISRDDNYGVKTFAAVHGNRSKYDVNSDIKINGWSTIVGVGNADKFDNGSEFSWGVFYENGSGNYRTYNEFNNDFFRGDGSLVYNGGGITARYTNKNGVYTEGSLRAGMLKSDMDNALRDGAGNYYGYESESAYYGAHIGIGKIISLSDSSDLDVYGKFFHTYTEGDSFKVANDEFEFNSINSDRLRIGARITSNKENKFSTYYGLAYEYEFNGDADMTAQGLKAPTQSLQGSSVMAEVGFNYQPTPDSPWSFDINMRGYTGERQGGSFNVQATYTF